MNLWWFGSYQTAKKKTVIECKTLCYSTEREIPGFAKWVFGEEEGSEEESIGE